MTNDEQMAKDLSESYGVTHEEEREKAIELKEKFGDLSYLVIEEILDNNSKCIGHYKTNFNRVTIRQWWIDVRNELDKLNN